MTPNTIRAQVSLSFKGENHDFDTIVDLDDYPDDAPDFHALLAKAAGVDTYSYLFEALESYDIEFSQATGLAAQCCEAGSFDWAQFAQLRSETSDWQTVRRIAEALLPGTALNDDPALKAALLAVYRAGKVGA